MRHKVFDPKGRYLFAVRSDKFSPDKSGVRRLLDSWPHHVVIGLSSRSFYAVTSHQLRKLIDSGIMFTIFDHLNAPVHYYDADGNGHWW